MDFLYSVDVSIFFFINHTLSNPIFDKFFVFLTDVKHWYLTYIILWFICFFKGGRIGKIAALTSLLIITFSDQFSSSLLKNWIGRIRPCNALENVNILVGCTGSFSLPSSHAVNNFAIAAFFGQIFKKYNILLFSIASIVALSRPYVGVHYPSDILAGAVIGIIIGYLFAAGVLKLEHYLNLRSKKD